MQIDVERIRQLKRAAEEAIAREVHKQFDLIHAETGLIVGDVSVSFTNIGTFERPDCFVVVEVKPAIPV